MPLPCHYDISNGLFTLLQSRCLAIKKFREFSEEFLDVGLMIGDVTIAPNASYLVMTTEILRSIQYKVFEIMREVAWIIFVLVVEHDYLPDLEVLTFSRVYTP
jgi:hypothetical protein